MLKSNLYKILENINIAFISIKGNKVRSFLTMAIIAVGVMALVGIVTAAQAIEDSVMSSFSSMGANTINITVDLWGNSSSNSRSRRNGPITYKQAKELKNNLDANNSISIQINTTGNATVEVGSLKSNPNVSIVACDENYLYNNGYELAQGRNISNTDVNLTSPVAVLGVDVANTVFNSDDVIGKDISINDRRYNVVGVLKSKGSAFGSSASGDRVVFIPVTLSAINYPQKDPYYRITIVPDTDIDVEDIVEEARAKFRIIRNLRPTDKDDFQININSQMMSNMNESLAVTKAVSYIIGFITLLGASVGLMNIMLVAVNEKTREIGTRMALGATKGAIKQQFLLESIIVSQLGGIMGIILGIIIGNTVASQIGISYSIPWAWIFIGVLVCLITGVTSGYLPAVRASKLDPIESLRHE